MVDHLGQLRRGRVQIRRRRRNLVEARRRAAYGPVRPRQRGGERKGAEKHREHGGVTFFLRDAHRLTDGRGQSAHDVGKNEKRRPVTEFDLVQELTDVHENHRARGESAALLEQPHRGEIFDERTHVQALTDGLHDGKTEGTVSAITIKRTC